MAGMCCQYIYFKIKLSMVFKVFKLLCVCFSLDNLGQMSSRVISRKLLCMQSLEKCVKKKESIILTSSLMSCWLIDGSDANNGIHDDCVRFQMQNMTRKWLVWHDDVLTYHKSSRLELPVQLLVTLSFTRAVTGKTSRTSQRYWHLFLVLSCSFDWNQSSSKANIVFQFLIEWA